MTFQLQSPAKVWDEEITTDKWPLPPAKPWAPKSSIEQMCEEALGRLATKLDEAVLDAELDIGFDFQYLRLRWVYRFQPEMGF